VAKSNDELIVERNKRVEDAVALREPDRVPFTPLFSFFPAIYYGISCRDYMYDYDKVGEATKKVVVDFEPDQYANPYYLFTLGPVLDIMDFKQLKWPGHGVPDDLTYQYVEKEYMLAEEYDDFLFDPTSFMLRTYLPRTCGILEPLKMLPDLPAIHYLKIPLSTALFANPEFAAMIEGLSNAGAEATKMLTKAGIFDAQMKQLGFPPMFGGSARAPFDFFGDTFRGTRGVLMDIFRHPDKLKEALKKVVPIVVKSGIASARMTGNPYIFMPLHKCTDIFMSEDKFRTFYWPTLQEVMLNLIDAGLIPCPLWEGNCTSRLDIIKEIPKGKAVYWFESTDMFKAKEILGDTVCLRGNVPASLLITGTTEEVGDYCKKLIDIVGRDGGYIMDGSIGIPDEAKPENVQTMAETTRSYGIYH
jgi:hypothetical protein